MQGSMLACLVALLVHQLLGTLVHKAYVPGYWTCFAGTTILMGCVVAILSCDEAYRSKAAPILRSKGVLLLSVVLWANPAIEFLQVGRLSIYMHGLGCALLVGWIYHNQQSTLVRLLEWRPLRYLGTISYGIYMYQGLLLTASPVRVDGRVWPLPPWLGFVVLCVIAPLSYHFLERPLIARGRRFRQRHLVVPKAVPDVPQVASHTPAP
jgi:peptidoglycan/LPS O-acetylase OafA/YrhL